MPDSSSTVRVVIVRAFQYSEHGCSLCFAGLEFTNSVHIVLTVCSVLLLAAWAILAISFAHEKLKNKA